MNVFKMECHLLSGVVAGDNEKHLKSPMAKRKCAMENVCPDSALANLYVAWAAHRFVLPAGWLDRMVATAALPTETGDCSDIGFLSCARRARRWIG
jgi:hypothetical protein